MDADGRIVLTPAQLWSLTAVLLLAFAASLGMPFNIDAVARSFRASNTVAGLLASSELAAIAAGTLLAARLTAGLLPRSVYLLGIGVIVACNLASVFAGGPAALLACRIPAGFALGLVVATVMQTAGRSRTPESTFGVINAMVGVMGVLIALVLPQALNLHRALPATLVWREVDGLYLVYLLFSVSALLFVRTTPAAAPVRPDSAGTPHVDLRSGWLALFGVGLIFHGHAALALFIVTIGRQLSLEPQVIGYVLMAGSLVGIVAPLAAGYLGSRRPALGLLTATLTLLIAAALGLASAHSAWQFFVFAPLFAMLPIALMPILLGALSRLDASGSLTGAHPAFVLIGSALAPFVGGALSDLGGFMVNGLFVALCVVVGAALGFPAVSAADRQRRLLSHAPVKDVLL